jgi:hypothetical protein
MRVEAGEHAVDGFGDEFLVVHRLDVVAFDLAVHLGEGAQVVNGQRGGGLLVRQRGVVEADHDADEGAEDDESDVFQFAAHDDRFSDGRCAVDYVEIIPDFPLGGASGLRVGIVHCQWNDH